MWSFFIIKLSFKFHFILRLT